MIRRLYITACGLSLLPCIAATVLWLMSSRPRVWWFGPDRPDATMVVVLERGAFTIHDRVGGWLGHWYSYELWRPFGAMAILLISPALYRTFRSTIGALLFGLLLNLTWCRSGAQGCRSFWFMTASSSSFC